MMAGTFGNEEEISVLEGGEEEPDEAKEIDEALQMTVSQIINDICGNPNITAEKVPEAFCTKVGNVLLDMKSCFPPSYGRKIDLISDELLKGGLSLDQAPSLGNEPIGTTLQAQLSNMYQLDKQIETLSDTKMTMYNSLFQQIRDQSNAEKGFLVSSNIGDTNQLPPDPLYVERFDYSRDIPRVCGMPLSKVSSTEFSPVTIYAAAARHDRIFVKVKQEDMIQVKQEIPTSLSSSPEDNFAFHSKIDLDEKADEGVESPSFLNRVSYNTDGSVVSCMKIVRKSCVAGTVDGKILTFSNTGILCEVIQGHHDVTTSIVIWKPRIISTSLDGTMSYFDVDSRVAKVINVGCPIMASREAKGILYLGTQTGHIIKYNVRSLTRIGDFIQVSSSIIQDLEIMEIQSATVIAVAPDKKPVTIRNAQTGSLIATLQYMEEISSLALIRSMPFHLCGIGEKGISVVHFNDGDEELVWKMDVQYAGYHIVENNLSLYCSNMDGDINVFCLEGTVNKTFRGTGEVINCLAVDKKRLIFCTNTTVTSIPLSENDEVD